ncbi:RHS repeat protein, partial [Xanthomonas vasicola]
MPEPLVSVTLTSGFWQFPLMRTRRPAAEDMPTATKVRGADASSEADDRITRIDYWPTGLVKQVTQPDGAFTAFTYDAA